MTADLDDFSFIDPFIWHKVDKKQLTGTWAMDILMCMSGGRQVDVAHHAFKPGVRRWCPTQFRISRTYGDSKIIWTPSVELQKWDSMRLALHGDVNRTYLRGDDL